MKKVFKIKNTLGMFDLTKGIIMILVLLGHTFGLFDVVNSYETNAELIAGLGIPRLTVNLILAAMLVAAMPVLFFVCGYGFRKTALKKCVKKQFKTLMIPYFVTAVITSAAHLVVFYMIHFGWLRYSIVESFKIFLGFLLGLPKDVTVFGFYIFSSGPMWFMMALFIGNIVFNELVSRFEGRKLLAASFITACAGWLMALIITTPWCISQGLISVFYICLGYLTKKSKLFIEPLTRKRIIQIVLIVIVSFVANSFGNFNMAESNYGIGPVSIGLFGLFGVAVAYLALYLNRFNGPICNGLRKIGRWSLYIICIHTIELRTAGTYLVQWFVERWTGSVFMRSMIMFGTRTVVVILATFCFVNIKDKLSKRKDNG